MLTSLEDPKSYSSVLTLYFFPHLTGQRMGKICFGCADAEGAATVALCEGHDIAMISGAMTPSDSSGRVGFVGVGDATVPGAAAWAEGWVTVTTTA